MCFSLFASAEAELRCRHFRSGLSLLGNQPTTKLRSRGGLERALPAAEKKKQTIAHSVSLSLQPEGRPPQPHDLTPQRDSRRVGAPQTRQQTEVHSPVGLPEAEPVCADPPN